MFIKEETAESIALSLGVPFQIIDKIKDRFLSEVYEVREPTVLRTFHILWYWRGRHSNRHMVEQILNVLRDMCKWELASVIHNAHKERRRIKMSDFSHIKS
ncbi:hypothetical protein FSP39_021143 [Pinctada imbricata]|uniref:Death domain-containing protein n=1 Tax=Pinctada imbricata TaxID=66713 RepID=A0AA88YVT5_PINIB|nr:hypothetical protein FSP39_021143 [Pinctada imbricata]